VAGVHGNRWPVGPAYSQYAYQAGLGHTSIQDRRGGRQDRRRTEGISSSRDTDIMLEWRGPMLDLPPNLASAASAEERSLPLHLCSQRHNTVGGADHRSLWLPTSRRLRRPPAHRSVDTLHSTITVSSGLSVRLSIFCLEGPLQMALPSWCRVTRPSLRRRLAHVLIP